MSRIGNIAVIAALILVLFTLCSMSGMAAENKSAVTTFASVDIAKILGGYEKSKLVDDQLAGLQASLRQKLQLRMMNKLIGDAEYKQLCDIASKMSPTADESKKRSEILEHSAALEKEFQSLQQNPKATDAEKARMNELQAIMDKNAALAKEDETSFGDQFQKKQEELIGGLKKDVESAVAAVAKEKGVSMVFCKSLAQFDFIIYSSNDITEDVVKKLNKK